MIGLFEQRIGGIEKLTMIDFPNQLAAILFYNGCNLRCPYCYNPSLIIGTPIFLPAKDVLDFLLLRKGVLDGIVFSGGECTLWEDKLVKDLEFVKNLGYHVKLDTNGQKPQFIKQLIDNKLIDYVALDIKCCYRQEKLFHAHLDLTYQTLQLLKNEVIPYETRTTVHPDITNEEDISEMFNELAKNGCIGQTHYLQYFFQCPQTLGNVSQKPRYFYIDRVDTHGLQLVERGQERNGKYSA